MKLCAYSRSKRHTDLILGQCPLLLNSTQAAECPCRQNEYHLDPYTYRVTACRQPATWYGGLMSSPEQAQQYLERKTMIATDPASKSDQSLKLPPLWEGIDIPIIGLTGPKASGKTLFASTIDPKNTLMFDCELSSETYVSGDKSYSIEYGQRIDIFAELQNRKKEVTPLEAWLLFKETVEGTKLRIVAVDTWDFIQAGLIKWIESQPEKFGRTRNEYEKASSMTLWPDVKSWLQGWAGTQAKRIGGSFVIINHLGTVWKDGKATDKTKAKGLDVIYQIASLYIRLDRGPNAQGATPKAPVGIIAEVLGGKCRLVRFRKDDAGNLVWGKDKDGKPTECADPILPPRIENCTPEMIRYYIKNPPNYDKLKKAELAVPETMSAETKLEIKAKMAEDIRVAEENKTSRLEMMRQAGQQRAAQQQQATAAKTATPAATQTVALNAVVSPQKSVAATSAAEPESKSEEPPFTGGEVAQQAIDKATEAGSNAKCEGKERTACPHSVESMLAKAWLAGFDATTVQQVVEWQRKALRYSDADWQKVLDKRNVKSTLELPQAQAEEIQKKLWEKLTKADVGKA